MKCCILFILFMHGLASLSQVAINTTGAAPDPNAGLDVDYPDKGFLPPRMSSGQRDAIINPPAGLQIYNTDTQCENFFNGTSWFELCGICTPAVLQPSVITGKTEPCAGASGLTYSVTNTP